MRIAIWLVAVVTATWVCRTMAARQGKKLTRVLKQVARETLVVSSGLCVESWFGCVLAIDYYLGYAAFFTL